MRKTLLLAALLTTAAWLPMHAAHNQEAEVRAALEHYLTAHATGDGTHLKGVFHDQGRMLWLNADTLAIRSFPDYVGGFRGTPAPDEAQRRRSIEVVDVTGRAAIGKVVLDYPNTRITDYMSLLRIDGQWQVVNKVFHSEPKRP